MDRRKKYEAPSQTYVEAIHEKVQSTLTFGRRAKYELGRIVNEVLSQQLYAHPDYPGAPEGGFPATNAGCSDWCRQVVGYERRTVLAIKSNYLALSALNLDERQEPFARCLRLGWTRLGHLLKVATNEATLVHWLDRIDNEKLSRDMLTAEIKLALGESAEDGEDIEVKKSTSSKDLTDAEAVNAIDDSQTIDSDTGEVLNPPSVAEDDERVFVDWNLRFTNRQALKIWVQGLEVIKRRLDTTSNGQAAATLATHYLATAPRDDEGGLAVELETLLQTIEGTYGVKLAVIEQGVSTPVPDTMLAKPEKEAVAAEAALDLATFP